MNEDTSYSKIPNKYHTAQSLASAVVTAKMVLGDIDPDDLEQVYNVYSDVRDKFEKMFD